MNRRRYLSAVGVAATTAGCVAAPRADRDGESEVESGSTGDESGDDGYGYGGSDADSGRTYQHDIGDPIRLRFLNATLIVYDTQRLDPAEFESAEQDVYAIEMRVRNLNDEQVTLDHDVFWIEKLGRDVLPDSTLSESFENGATGDATTLIPGEGRRLTIAFEVPDDVDPEYLWAIPGTNSASEAYYICLVPHE